MRFLLLRSAQPVTAATDFLTETRLRGAKPKGRPYKLRDGGSSPLAVRLLCYNTARFDAGRHTPSRGKQTPPQSFRKGR